MWQPVTTTAAPRAAKLLARMATRSLRGRSGQRGESTLWSLLTLTTCVALVAVVALTIWVARRGGHLEPLQLSDGITAAWGRMRGRPAEGRNVAAAAASGEPAPSTQEPVAEGPGDGTADETEPDETTPPAAGAPPKKVTKKPTKKKATKKR